MPRSSWENYEAALLSTGGRIYDRRAKQLVLTDTIPVEAAMARCPRIRSLSIAPLLGEAIRRIHDEESVSTLFV